MSDFTVRDTDTTWRRLQDEQPPDDQPVELHIKAAGTIRVACAFDWETATWRTPSGRFSALPSDLWRPEDER